MSAFSEQCQKYLTGKHILSNVKAGWTRLIYERTTQMCVVYLASAGRTKPGRASGAHREAGGLIRVSLYVKHVVNEYARRFNE